MLKGYYYISVILSAGIVVSVVFGGVRLDEDFKFVIAWVEIVLLAIVVAGSILNERLGFVSEWTSRVVLIVYAVLILVLVLLTIVPSVTLIGGCDNCVEDRRVELT